MKKVLFSANVFRHFTAFHTPYMKMLMDKGYEVYAIANEDYGGHKEQLDQIGVHTIEVPINRNPLSTDNLKSYQILKETMKSEDFDIVHVHTPIAAFLTRLAKPAHMKGKLIYTAHGFHFFKDAPLMNWLLYFPLEKMTAAKTDLLITTNNEDTVTAKRLGFSNDNLIHIKGVGVEIDHPQLTDEEKLNLRTELGLSSSDKVIICVAEMNDNKNQMFILQNWNNIKEAVPEAVLLFAGIGPNLELYEQYKTNNHLKDVHFLGFRRDVPNLLQISDVMTLLSHREGLPKSIMEGMAQGLPCVVTDTRGLVDLVDDNENGYIVEKGNDESLTYAFVKLLKDDNLRKNMGDKSKEKVESFTLDSVMKDYEQAYLN
ncbi:glycosyltransferase family 1 protein [Macrococcus epidermidis]|uniref:Glycosyltransferase family 1 protein n=2 Tax=Macrococcus epidermidis TaxID=1902580 RepID=A0A327ZXQ2_9STAP|nr:glycosyltransferase family 4 protein [Macrococcus epidermidis]MCG7420226.1 glycosyltransferase family 4 protein [Macrococcus epidermidis]RAK46294.1 glycosyltransferase family 1 protein [Macrococcus epidermidis]